MTHEARLRRLRTLIMSKPSLREHAEVVVEAVLAELSEEDDAAAAPEWLQQAAGAPLTVAELRARLRLTLAELAAKD